jgi:cobalt/nickel transport system ATP-binding protein
LAETIFSIRDVRFQYDDIIALDGVSFEVTAGEAIALLGANGSGKSTLLKMLDGLLFPTHGSILAFGEGLDQASLKDEGFSQAFRRRVGFVFQNADVQLFSPTVREEVAFGPLHLGLPEDEITRRVDDTIHILGLEHLRERAPYNLSGGEKKRVALASVLAINPDVLLFDEPTAGLDPKTSSFLVGLMSSLNAAGKTIITATQDLSIVSAIAGRVLIMGEDHRLTGEGSPDAILEDWELLKKANLIHDHPHRHEGMVHDHPHSHVEKHEHGHQERYRPAE